MQRDSGSNLLFYNPACYLSYPGTSNQIYQLIDASNVTHRRIYGRERLPEYPPGGHLQKAPGTGTAIPLTKLRRY